MIDDFGPRRRPLKVGSQDQTQTNKTDEPEEPRFTPPEEVAASDLATDSTPQPETKPQNDTPGKMNPLKRYFKNLNLSRKQLVLIGVAAFVVLAGGSLAAYKLLNKPAPAPVAVKKVEPPKKTEPPKPTTVASPLTGVQVTPELTQLPVTGVIIENSPDARPQSGLKDAGVVYEAIAEGGITRFLALYQEAQPDYVGPVRSVRPYYLEWLMGYDAAIAHAGGSPEALALIRSAGVKDLDQFANGGSYQRVSTRYAPHNVYTSLPKLIELSKAKGFTKSTFTGFARKAAAPSATPNAKAIDMTISGALYNVHYDYDPGSNTYKRVMGGKPHNDERSGNQIAPSVVVAMVVPFGLKPDGLHSDYKTTGSGKAFIFQDGTVTEGTWEKRGSKDPIRFGDANGAPLGINPGQTWVTAVKLAGSVAYKP